MNILVKNLSSGISIVQINDPKTYNTLSFKTLNDLIKVLKKLDQDKKTKVIIIEGAGKGFSAGHNLKEVKSLKVRNKYQKLFNLCSKLMLQIVEGNKPVIAKVHGAAYAAGCQLVASCDLAYSTKDALFATPGVNIGLFCSTPIVSVSRKIFKTSLFNLDFEKQSFIKPISFAKFALIGSPVSNIFIIGFLLIFLLTATIGVLQNNPIFTPGVANNASLVL